MLSDDDVLLDLVYVDGEPDARWAVREFPDDVQRIVRVLESQRLAVDPAHAASAWESFSNRMFAGWLSLPASDVELLAQVMTYLRAR